MDKYVGKGHPKYVNKFAPRNFETYAAEGSPVGLFLKLPPYTPARFDLTTHIPSLHGRNMLLPNRGWNF
jgi:hypothetical protein